MEQNQDVEVLKEKILEQLINFIKEKTEAEVQPEDKWESSHQIQLSILKVV